MGLASTLSFLFPLLLHIFLPRLSFSFLFYGLLAPVSISIYSFTSSRPSAAILTPSSSVFVLNMSGSRPALSGREAPCTRFLLSLESESFGLMLTALTKRIIKARHGECNHTQIVSPCSHQRWHRSKPSCHNTDWNNVWWGRYWCTSERRVTTLPHHTEHACFFFLFCI